MEIKELRKQRNEAIQNALNGQVYIKKNGKVEFIDINDMELNIQGITMSFNDYFKGIAEYQLAINNNLKQVQKELDKIKTVYNDVLEKGVEEYLKVLLTK
jgi:hypothetical protein